MSAREVPLLFRFVYFLVFGLWAGGICAQVGWLLCVTVIGLPFGIWLLHRLPLITTLTMPDEDYAPVESPEKWTHAHPRTPDAGFPFLIRVVWFVLVGWWFSFVWINGAFILAGTIILSPFGFWMINRVPAVLTLEGV